MSSVTISPSVVSGRFSAPPSRDDTLRLLWASILGEGGVIGNCHEGLDTQAVISLGRQMGADIYYSEGVADIFSQPNPMKRLPLTCLTPLAARLAIGLSLQYEQEVLVRSPRLPTRAMDFIAEIAAAVGASVAPNDAGSVKVKGPIGGLAIPLHGQEGAFWSTSLSMVSTIPPDETYFSFDDFSANQPAFSDTLSVMDAFGVVYSFDQTDNTLVVPGGQVYSHRLLDAEGDWRNSAYVIGALLAAGQGSVEGLSQLSRQNERSALSPLESAGLLSWDSTGERIFVKAGSLPSVPIDPRRAPSLIPLWMALSLYASTPISIGPLHPISPLAQKRISMLTDIFQTLGATVEYLSESVIVHPSKLRGGTVDAQNDARVSMALAIAALGGTEPIKIENVQGVADVFPEFWATLKSMGADVTLPTFSRHASEKPMLP